MCGVSSLPVGEERERESAADVIVLSILQERGIEPF